MEEAGTADTTVPERTGPNLTGRPRLVIVLMAVIFYVAGLYNEYAIDDTLVIHQNSAVLQGIAGIGEILTQDDLRSFNRRMGNGKIRSARFRPLPQITYAIEQEIMHPYRSGYYVRAEDLNRNGVLDHGPVTTGSGDDAEKTYEYNEFADRNGDGIAAKGECHSCWDTDYNGASDPSEDLNYDGVFSAADCELYMSWFRHFNNLVIYIAACLAFFSLLRAHVLPGRATVALLTALLFVVHPVHSEVVANVKGREDLMAFFFICISLSAFAAFGKQALRKDLVKGCTWMFLGLLCKEQALLIVLIAPAMWHIFRGDGFSLRRSVLPAILFCAVMTGVVISSGEGYPAFFPLMLISLSGIYVLWLVFSRKDSSAQLAGSMCCVVLLYFVWRGAVATMSLGSGGTDVLSDPYLNATMEEGIATRVFVLLRYLGLQFFPYPLQSNYAFADIAFRQFRSAGFILAAILYSAMAVATVVLVRRKHIAGFALMLYFVFTLFAGNIFFQTGVMMSEGPAFYSSAGICLLLAWAFSLLQMPVILRSAVAVIVAVVCLPLVWDRVTDWKNDETLFLGEVRTGSNSVITLANAAARLIDRADSKEIILAEEFEAAGVPGGSSLRQLVLTEEEFRQSKCLTRREAVLRKAIAYLKKTLELHPGSVNSMLNLGLASYKLDDFEGAWASWKMAASLYPSNPYLRQYTAVLSNQLGARGNDALASHDYHGAFHNFSLLVKVDEKDTTAWRGLGSAAYQLEDWPAALTAFSRALKLDPSDTNTGKLLRLVSRKLN